MIIGKITGTIVSTQKDERLDGFKFYTVEELDRNMNKTGKSIIAVDIVGSGVGEIVMLAQGSSARQSSFTDKKPVDAAVIAIIDTMEIDGELKYQKE